ncbi:unnamed protein product [Moneuplotes crassus]|uniref:Uncharacterized protein n=1 Tax=Euplotes crassus TaxID=5936 RepID=A0AAD1XY47_EUPCR|nr:unnamed protein product [Moneuplotes crassus]
MKAHFSSTGYLASVALVKSNLAKMQGYCYCNYSSDHSMASLTLYTNHSSRFRMSSLSLPVSPPVSYNHISCKVKNSLSNQTKVDFGLLIGSQPYLRSVLSY